MYDTFMGNLKGGWLVLFWQQTSGQIKATTKRLIGLWTGYNSSWILNGSEFLNYVSF